MSWSWHGAARLSRARRHLRASDPPLTTLPSRPHHTPAPHLPRHQFFKSYPAGSTDSHEPDSQGRSRSGSGDGRGSMDTGGASETTYVLKRPQNRQRTERGKMPSDDDGANRTLRSVIGVDTQGKDGNDTGPGARWRQVSWEVAVGFGLVGSLFCRPPPPSVAHHRHHHRHRHVKHPSHSVRRPTGHT